MIKLVVASAILLVGGYLGILVYLLIKKKFFSEEKTTPNKTTKK